MPAYERRVIIEALTLCVLKLILSFLMFLPGAYSLHAMVLFLSVYVFRREMCFLNVIGWVESVMFPVFFCHLTYVCWCPTYVCHTLRPRPQDGRIVGESLTDSIPHAKS